MKTLFKLLVIAILLNSCTKEVIILEEVIEPDKTAETSLEELGLTYSKTVNPNDAINFIEELKSEDSALIIVSTSITIDQEFLDPDSKTTNKILKFEEAGQLVFSNNSFINFQGYLYANPFSHIFNIDGTTSTPLSENLKNDIIYPDWFGAITYKDYNKNYNSVYDNSKAIQFSLDIASARTVIQRDYSHNKYHYNGKKVKLNTGFYGIKNKLNLPSGVELFGNGQSKSWIFDAYKDGLDLMIEIKSEKWDESLPDKDSTGAVNVKNIIFAGNININNIGFKGVGANSSGTNNWKTKRILKATEAVYNFTIDDCRFEKAHDLIWFYRCFGDVTIKNSNLSFGIGSAINIKESHSFNLENCRVENIRNLNETKRSAALIISTSQPVSVNNSVFQFNDAYAIWALQANQLNVTNCYFEDNFIKSSSTEDVRVNGYNIVCKNTVQANITDNSFAFARDLKQTLSNGEQKVFVHGVLFDNTRLAKFDGNRITNKIRGNEETDKDKEGYPFPREFHSFEQTVVVSGTDYYLKIIGMDEDPSCLSSNTPECQEMRRKYIIQNNFVDTDYTRNLEDDEKPHYLK